LFFRVKLDQISYQKSLFTSHSEILIEVAKIYLDKQSIEQLIKAFNQRDLEPGSKLFAEDIVLH